MKRVLKVFLCVGLSAVVMAGLLAAALLHSLPTDGIHVTVDGESWTLPALQAGHWLVATVCLLVVGLVLAVVVPCVLMVGVGLPLLLASLAIGIAIAVALLAAGLMLSPVLLLAGLLWLVWRLLERKPKDAQAPAAATIHG
ncbi:MULTISPECIES: hypothetical protein [unclassified Rhizobacter]|uniref:hypothetical protein n=1 Tax=unclassified Rhizobacter TaxID=2640088 RepID=UPI0006FA7B9D|nr:MULTISPECIES: hypothetical protein [unclassified Rhizobacter]KQU78331.1 hypothetical protein ASC88_21240 [Rhizobacter sp. Root29]KQW16077.1 hypothetical protein ASC98_02460 [Rhizobacter sp. Root1238]KRB25196.1 hypothetical protein ASE08_03210 [Rhizobacter sp. Root16D2]